MADNWKARAEAAESRLADLKKWADGQKRFYRGTDGVDHNVRKILDAVCSIVGGGDGECGE